MTAALRAPPTESSKAPSLQQTLLGVHRRSWQLAGMDTAPFPYAASHPPSPREPPPEPEPEPQPEQERTDLLGQEFRILAELQKLEGEELEPLRGTLAAMARSLDVLENRSVAQPAPVVVGGQDDELPGTPGGAGATGTGYGSPHEEEEARRLQEQAEAAAERVMAAQRTAEHASGMAEQARRMAAAAEERAESRRAEYMELTKPQPECSWHPADDLMVSIDILGSDGGESAPSERTAGETDARPGAPTPRRASGLQEGSSDGHSGSASAAAEKVAWEARHGWHESDGSAQISNESAHYAMELQGEDGASSDGFDDEYSEHSHGSADGGPGSDIAASASASASAAQEAMYRHAFQHLQYIQQLRHQREQLRIRAAREPPPQTDSPPDERTSMVMGDLRGRVSVGAGGAVALDLSGHATQSLV